ncbi:hypothetical protein M427DRAFT_31167 [Gonapodya prolifera JEL478]|uniref:Uncharacterized protein n=1 Tax=Gonapodya prolifera (strain JEL478) TaxID=1344416 RepID=A0A139AHZ4_GONPJ|nr:hypothetical protein M427DRAFT_31167 [Gonapodya prolifera JEL478]|eukprot:KXS16436.1 hypothetical protein M427DRAFT_31167 [Gonapodya prolifera JEL478]
MKDRTISLGAIALVLVAWILPVAKAQQCFCLCCSSPFGCSNSNSIRVSPVSFPPASCVTSVCVGLSGAGNCPSLAAVYCSPGQTGGLCGQINYYRGGLVGWQWGTIVAAILVSLCCGGFVFVWLCCCRESGRYYSWYRSKRGLDTSGDVIIMTAGEPKSNAYYPPPVSTSLAPTSYGPPVASTPPLYSYPPPPTAPPGSSSYPPPPPSSPFSGTSYYPPPPPPGPPPPKA